VLVDLSTNSPEVVRELGARLRATGHHLVEAPLTAARSVRRSGCCRSWSAATTASSLA
jgi:3-hydroxyisobutyrate dehydrogenase-like beta-hydroxyacid dehydrogenase